MADVTSPFGFPYPENTDLVRDGAQDIENLATGVNDQLALGYLYVGTRYYTSSGTFAKADPFGDSSFDGAKLRAIRVRMVGGGGGSGGAATTGAGDFAIGGSAGGGGYAERFFTNIAALDTSVTVTRGGGGAGGSPGANAGSAGGVSEFGTASDAWRTRATGGASGPAGGAVPANLYTQRGATGGDGTDGNLLISGNNGQNNYGSANLDFIWQAPGGASQLGPGSDVQGGGGSSGQAGKNYGSGASGATNTQNQGTARAGGAGANGIVIIDVFA